jgi:branched-subunit amino acid aminotransferase/4-amino-4-deoxychorismate lyase
MTQLWCNGQWLETRDLPVSPMDRGVMWALGLFETILVLDGVAIFAERHLARLAGGCERLGWQMEHEDLRAVMEELIERNGLTRGRARIRLAMTGGSGSANDLALGLDHVVWMTAVASAEPPMTTSMHLAPWVRNERSPLAGLKCASYAENLVALHHAARLGFEETLFLNTAGQLCEAATANVFLVKNGGLWTPSLASGCLPGITRSVVIELAGQLGVACQEAALSLEDLQESEELFLTSSIRGLMGVDRFEEQVFPSGRVTRILSDAWQEVTRRKN